MKISMFPLTALLAVAMIVSPVMADDAKQADKTNQSTATQSDNSTESTEPDAKKAEKQTEATESVQDEVDKETEKETEKQRKRLVDDAVKAVHLTPDALAAIDEGKEDEALKTLERVTGKLELVLARDPGLSMVPVAVTTTIYDVLAKTETVEELVEAAEEALDDGRVQEARRLLKNLASEVVVSTTSLPMATYPDAIKAVAPLIDKGETEKAKQQLQLALNLLLVTDVAMPLPTTRANVMLDEAEKLAEKSDRSEEDNERLTELLTEAHHQVEFGRELGYFSEDRAEEIYEALDEIEEKTGGGKSGEGFFDKVRGFFKRLDWRD